MLKPRLRRTARINKLCSSPKFHKWIRGLPSAHSSPSSSPSGWVSGPPVNPRTQVTSLSLVAPSPSAGMPPPSQANTFPPLPSWVWPAWLWPRAMMLSGTQFVMPVVTYFYYYLSQVPFVASAHIRFLTLLKVVMTHRSSVKSQSVSYSSLASSTRCHK